MRGKTVKLLKRIAKEQSTPYPALRLLWSRLDHRERGRLRKAVDL